MRFVKPSDKNIKSISIPKTIAIDGLKYKVTSIGNNAFKDCKKLKTVTIGSNVEVIGTGAFSGCTGVTKITIPSKVTTIKSKALYTCKSFKNLVVKTTHLQSVGSKAFGKTGKGVKAKLPGKYSKTYKKLLKKAGLVIS